MITWLSHYIYGCLLIRLNGFSPERFLNLCSANEIEIWNLQYHKDGYEFYMAVKGFRRIKPFVRKSKVKLKILKKFGLPFFLHRNRRRKLYFAGVISFFIILYMLSLFIWDISFEGNTKYTYDTLLKFLESQNIHCGMMKSGVGCEDIEAAIRTQFSEITWVSARVSGTRLLIKVKENEVLSAVPQRDTTPCDLVASRQGTITSMVVRQGIPQVAVGDTVEPGQLLVKGVIPITNDGEEEVNRHYVHADGDIFAKTTYDYTETFPMLHEVKAETGRQRRGYYIKILNYSFMAILPKKEGTTWNMVMEEEQLRLFSNFYLPVYLGKISGNEYITYERFYTEDEKKQAALVIQQKFKKNLIEKGVQIIENNVKIYENESNCIVEGHLETEEAIGRTQAVTETIIQGDDIPK